MGKTDKELLAAWVLWQKRYGVKHIKTSEVYAWGVQNYSNRAVRNMQNFAAKGELVKRIDKEEAILLGFSGNEGVWEIL